MKPKRILIISGIILFFIAAAAVSFVTYRLVAVDMASRPAVQFLEPVHDQEIPLGDMLVRFIARDREGIEHVELWIDGELYAARKSQLPKGSNPFPFVEMWVPETEGTHTLTARAFNTQNRDTVASVVVRVSEEIISDQVVTESPSEEGSRDAPAPESGSTSSLDEEEVSEEGDDVLLERISDEIIINPLQEEITLFEPSILGSLLPPLIPREDSFGILLEVEALILETSDEFNGVFCYYSFTGMPTFEKAPETGFFDTSGSRQWDIAAYLGGENKRIIHLPEEQSNVLGLSLECYGAIFEAGAVYNLGLLTAIHLPTDWNGIPISQHVEGPSGSFDISYRISPAGFGGGGGDGEELPAPILAVNCFTIFHSNYCKLEWIYPLEARERIDGFLLIRDDTLFMDIPHPEEIDIIISDLDGTMPSCGDIDNYYLIAYSGDATVGERSPESNHVSIVSPCMYQWVKIQFVKFSGCYSGDASINTCGTADVSGDAPEQPPDYSNSYDSDNGCLYADFWANEANIDVGQSGSMFDCYEWADGNNYLVDDIAFVENDFVLIHLEEFDDITIGMKVMDWDRVGSDDTQCGGEYIHESDEIKEIAGLPDRKRRFTRWFTEGGGGCKMTYVIELMLPDWAPSFLDDISASPADE